MRKSIYQLLRGLLFAVGLHLGASLLAENEQTTLRIMSYNIHRGGVVMLKQPLSQTVKAIRLKLN